MYVDNADYSLATLVFYNEFLQVLKVFTHQNGEMTMPYSEFPLKEASYMAISLPINSTLYGTFGVKDSELSEDEGQYNLLDYNLFEHKKDGYYLRDNGFNGDVS